MGFIYFVLGAFLIFDLSVWMLLFRKVWRAVSWPFQVVFHAFFAVQLTLVVMMYRGLHHSGISHLFHVLPPPVLSWIYLWHLLLAPLFLVGALVGLTGEGLLAFGRLLLSRGKTQPAADENLKGLPRRRFLGTLLALAPAFLTGGLGAVAASQQGTFRVRRFTIPVRHLPKELDGMTIAQVTDLHIGPFTSSEMLNAVVETTNGLQADLNVFTGDLINNDPYWLPQAVETLQRIRPAIVSIKGNHDQGNLIHPFDQTLRAGGLCLLVNESVTQTIRGVPVQLLGLRWDGPYNWQNRGDERALQISVEELLAQRDPAAFPILLAHHPHAWDYCRDIPLTLSGHTHGGQLMLSENHGFGPAMFRYWTGLYRQAIAPGQPEKTLVVSNGVGNWFPLRVNAPAEIVHLTLRCA